MSTDTLRHLCDAMDALDGAEITSINACVVDSINSARGSVAFAIRDAVDSFEIEAGQIDQESWRAGYEAALEDFDITDEDVAAADELPIAGEDETTYDVIDSMLFRDEIDEAAAGVLFSAYADSAPGEEDEDVMVAACRLYDEGDISSEAFERLGAATEG